MKLVVWMLAAIMAALTASGPAAAQQGGPIDLSDFLPDDFRGTISYQGSHGALLDRGPRRGTRQYGGSLTIELSFNGNRVTGRFSGTGGINSGTLSGTRDGNHCRLVEARGGDVIEGECTRSRFSARARSTSGKAMTASFEAQATRFVDAAVEERKRAALAASAPPQSQSQRTPSPAAQTAGMAPSRPAAPSVSVAKPLPAAPNVNSAPRATPAQSQAVARALQSDSQHWKGYRYDTGSFNNARVVDVRGEVAVIQGHYTYDGGKPGWMRAHVIGSRVTGIRYEEIDQYLPPRMPVAEARADAARVERDSKCLTSSDLGPRNTQVEVRRGPTGEVLRVENRAEHYGDREYRNVCDRSITIAEECPLIGDGFQTTLGPRATRRQSGICWLAVR